MKERFGLNDDLQGLFARRLKSLRLEHRISQERLGCAVGLEESVAGTRINRYENGVHQPDILMAMRLANELEVPLPYFYTDSDLVALILRKLYKLDDSELQVLFDGLN